MGSLKQWKKGINELQTTIAGGAIIVGASSIGSRMLGLYRDRLLLDHYEATRSLDIYLTAFKLPDFIFNVLVLGALSSAFIPLFIRSLGKSGGEKIAADSPAFSFANNVLHVLIFPVLALSLAVLLFAPEVMQFLAPGFSLAERTQGAELTRIMLLSVIFFTLSNISSGILNATRSFFSFALAPLFYNLGIIIGITVFAPRMGLPGLAWGVALGAALHFLIQLPSVLRLGYRYQWIFDLRDERIRTLGRMMIPRTLTLMTTQLNLLINVTLGSLLPGGSVAIFHFATNLQYFPISAFGISLAISSFPLFSLTLSGNDLEGFRRQFSMTVRRILFLMIPTSIGVLLLRAQIVRLIYGSQQVSWETTYLTAQTLGILSIAMVAEGLIPVLARAFYAKHNTRTPFLISLCSLGVNLALALLLFQWKGVFGLAAAYAASSLAALFLLLAALHRSVGGIDEQRLVQAMMRILPATLAMALAIHGGKYWMASIVDMQTFVGILSQTLVSAAFGIITYFGISLHFHFEEVEMIRARLLRWFASIVILFAGK